MKKYIFIIFSLVLFIPTVYAIEECTPSDDYLEFLKLSEEERKNVIEPIYCKEAYEYDNNNIIESSSKMFIDNILGASATQEKYSAVEDGLVTSPKDQYDDGTCWDFSAVSVVETNAIKNGLPTYDLSEAHVAYSLLSDLYRDSTGKKGKYNASADGGKITYAATYFFNNVGVLFENELSYATLVQANNPYLDRHKLPTISSDEYVQGHKTIAVDTFEIFNIDNSGSCTYNEIYNIKNRISEYGSVQATIHTQYMSQYLKNDIYYNVYDKFRLIDHAITIVGWDDTISKNNFNGAIRDGAWLVKNSWNTDWGNNGYFYVSYDDVFICKGVASYRGVSNTTFDNTYKSSEVAGVTFYSYNNRTFIASTFNKESTDDEVIKKISFATPLADGTSTVRAYVSFEDDWQEDYDSWKLLGTYSSNILGIDSIYTDMPIESDNYTIILDYDCPTSFVMLISSINDDDITSTTLSNPEYTNFYSENNQSSWQDARYRNFKPNIYVYTDTEESDESSIVINSVNENDSGFIANISNTENKTINTIKIYNDKNEDITDQFTINNNEDISIININLLTGRFKLVLIDEDDKETHYYFDIVEKLLLPSSFRLNSDYNIITIPQNTTYSDTERIVVKNSNKKIYSQNDSQINSGNIGSGFYLKTNDNTYYFIVKGDVTGDGKLSPLDYVKIRKHLVGSSELPSIYLFAADYNNDDKVSPLDYVKIRKALIS